jgi:hypothetical protein
VTTTPDDPTLRPDPGDAPEVAQMKLLRLDLRDDKRLRAEFERRINRRSLATLVAAGLTTVTMAVGGLFVGDRVGDLQDADDATDAELLAACEERAEGREGVKSGILAGDVNVIVELGRAFGREPTDPRVVETVEAVRASGQRRLDEVLPPIACDGG